VKYKYMHEDSITKHTEALLRKLSVEFDEIAYKDDGLSPMCSIATKDAGVLIGNNGEHLRALNYILKKIVEKETEGEPVQFLLDVNGYQRKKIQAIKQQAELLAERARVFKTNVEMSPMNAYERMIVHNIFTDDPDIETESTGEGKHRRVVFKCKRERNFSVARDIV